MLKKESNFEQNPEFLEERFPDLSKSKEVGKAVRRTEKRMGEEISKDPEVRIQNYLDRFKEILERKDSSKKECGINALKKILIDHYVVRVEDIPENYWHAQLRVIRSRGEMGDWQELPEEEQLKIKQEHLVQTKEDQKGSLEEWIDYLASDRASYLPDYLKYWVFQGMLRLERYEKGDKEKGISGRFPKRPTGKQRSIKMFPEANERALKFIAKAHKARAEGKPIEIDRHDIPQETHANFFDALAKKDFRSLYGWGQEYLSPISQKEMEETRGEWITYAHSDNLEENRATAKKIAESLQGKGSGWCIAGKNMAEDYLNKSDILIYYTRDKGGKNIIPRVVIVRQGNKGKELRGIECEENLDDYIKETNIISDKLKELGDEDFLEIDVDTKYLTNIDKKVSAGQPLTRDELFFLYEIERPIKYFGYKKDPRIEEIRTKGNYLENIKTLYGYDFTPSAQPGKEALKFLYKIDARAPESLERIVAKIREERNPKEDAPIILKCRPEQIAWSQDEINKNTKTYIGPLFPGIFETQIEDIYISFPDKKIEIIKNFEVEPMTFEEFKKRVIEHNQNIFDKSPKITISDCAERIFQKIGTSEYPALKNKEIFSLASLDVGDFFRDEKKHHVREVYQRAEELGLELCPPELAPNLLLKDLRYLRRKVKNFYFSIAMEAIPAQSVQAHYGHRIRSNIFVVEGGCNNSVCLASNWCTNLKDMWAPDDYLVFCLRKLKKET